MIITAQKLKEFLRGTPFDYIFETKTDIVGVEKNMLSICSHYQPGEERLKRLEERTKLKIGRQARPDDIGRIVIDAALHDTDLEFFERHGISASTLVKEKCLGIYVLEHSLEETLENLKAAHEDNLRKHGWTI